MQARVGFIGSGNMAEALIGALLRSGALTKELVVASDVSQERRDRMRALFGIDTDKDNANILMAADVLVLSVKPQQMAGVLQGLAETAGFPGPGRKLFISIAAGVRLARIEQSLYAGLGPEAQARVPIIRVMPNTPALVGAGMAGLAKNRHATMEDESLAVGLLSAAGRVRVFDEKDLDAVTAVSGSGPAYAFYLAEAMMAGAAAEGLSPDAARELCIQTIKGAALLLEDQNEPPEVLRARVTSPGGTTEAAFKVLEKNNVKDIFVSAIHAARQRSEEL